MSNRSPSVERICAAAVIHFAERGYDAASLNDIAVAVGIRKASLYAHFVNKDALFMEVFNEALQLERNYMSQCFADEPSDAQAGSYYCASLAQRYQTSEYLRLLLRTAYFPPTGLQPAISLGFEAYLEELQSFFIRKLPKKQQNWLSEAYLAMVDSLHIELIYAGGKSFEKRLKAMQKLLSQALASQAVIAI
ncbi:TetR/AcrR family transcriptional regulator [Pseudomonas sp. F1_0610]|uniref:TetR/AcrR family transcriptional regulator n=1 Tax=Pseudomonas sp. F1_0610 TaxID=3114284 RepID=UPI0039C01855